ncbi:hypothetical protein K7432_011715 [Basidiobolus ranarum]|uniref:HNH domain-containing protein n=1 Tax=Basidiobolus ranarum TaxID=34480 RepID=A0ABR2VTK3_9FUNG
MDDRPRKQPKLAPRQKQIYENYQVFSKEGVLLFRCNQKRLEWYHSRGLAQYIDDKSIRLNFETKGTGRAGDEFYLEDQENICVVCGGINKLSLHHVVPDMYRRHMPECIKSRSSFDLLPLCLNCHDEYEKFAMQYKKSLVKKYLAPLEGTGWTLYPENRPVSRAAAALIKSRDKIPPSRILELEGIVMAWWNQTHENTNLITDSILDLAAQLVDREKSEQYKEHGKIVVDQLMECSSVTNECRERWPDLEVFIMSWRQHFLQHARPRYLSDNWSVEQSIYNR